MTGEVTIGTSTLLQMPWLSSAPVPAAMRPAPISPPMMAWLDELGMPYHQVMRFQAMAPMSAAATIAWVATPSTRMPLAIDFATAVPANAPMKLKAAAMVTAMRGERARVATDVAIALAVSWNPLM
jgi:hypothetical protein